MKQRTAKRLTLALFIFYLLVLSAVILCKRYFSFRFLGMMFTFIDPTLQRSVNLIPLGGMLVLNGTRDYTEVLLNVLVFVPFGVFLCLLKEKKAFLGLVVPIFLTSLFFEVAQYLFVLGASDITDVLANTLGGIIGIGLFFVLHKLCREKVYTIINVAGLVIATGFIAVLTQVRPLP